MNLTLSLSPQESAELERRAAAAGTDIKAFLLHIVHDLDAVDEPSANDIPYDHWKRDFEQWLQGHQVLLRQGPLLLSPLRQEKQIPFVPTNFKGSNRNAMNVLGVSF